jgi:RHS repeat-associated protein
MEFDKETGAYTTFNRMLDVRLGRWWSNDPVVRAFINPYNFCSNNPIVMIDTDGDSDFYAPDGTYLGSDGTKGTDILVVTDSKLEKTMRKSMKSIKDKDYFIVTVTPKENQFMALPPARERAEILAAAESVNNLPNGQYREVGGMKMFVEKSKCTGLRVEKLFRAKDGDPTGIDGRPEIVINDFVPSDRAYYEDKMERCWDKNSEDPNKWRDEIVTIEYSWHSHPNMPTMYRSKETDPWSFTLPKTTVLVPGGTQYNSPSSYYELNKSAPGASYEDIASANIANTPKLIRSTAMHYIINQKDGKIYYHRPGHTSEQSKTQTLSKTVFEKEAKTPQ